MNFLVIYPGEAPYFTNWFNNENWVDGMSVINLLSKEYFNGKIWFSIEEDHL